MDQKGDVRWLIKCLSVGLVLLLACGLCTAWLGSRALQMPATTTRDGTLITLNRYKTEPVPDIVLVGSSLTYRLKEEYFDIARVRNLALVGGSPLTGLEIVARQSRLPKLVLVEMNVMTRPVDASLVKKYSEDSSIEPLFARPLRLAVAFYENWMHAPLSHSQISIDGLLKQPPSDFDNHVYVDRAVQQLDAEDPSVEASANVDGVRQMIPELENKGTRVLLFELPVADRLERTKSVEITGAIVHAAFPKTNRWLPIDVDRSDLRWADGAHLDERSAVMVVEAIETALRTLKYAD